MQSIANATGGFLNNWWVLLVRGVAAIIFGVLAFVWPGQTLLALVYLFGIYAIVDGVLALWFTYQAAQDQKRWWPYLLEGIVGIAAGIIAFASPGITALALVFVVAAWAILTGVVEIAAAIELRKLIDNEWLLGLSGVFSIIFGVLVAAQPRTGAPSIVYLVGIYAVLFGITLVGLAFRLRGLRDQLGQSRASA
jgi:uncharacterized membrane protein HdeD (DUF308 family)